MTRAVVYLVALAAAGVARAEPPEKSEVVPELQKGGYVIFVRHPKTDPDQADTDPLHLENVKAQRQLTDEGRTQAKDIGAALRALKIPVGKVIASKFHRAQEAAKLLNVGEVTASVDVAEGGLVVSPRENERRAKALRELLSTMPAKRTNVIIVSHKPNLQDAAGKEFGDVAEGETVVFQPLGGGKFKAVVRVTPETWSQWVK